MERVLSSVDHVQVREDEGVYQHMYSFPNAIELTLRDSLASAPQLFTIGLNRILSLQRIKTLTVKSNPFYFKTMLDLLFSAPNVQTLTVETITSYKEDRRFIEQYQIFQILSKRNRVTNVTVKQKRAFDVYELFVKLFPRVENLSIHILIKDMKSILQLLSKDNARHLLLICFNPANPTITRCELLTTRLYLILLLICVGVLTAYTSFSVRSKSEFVLTPTYSQYQKLQRQTSLSAMWKFIRSFCQNAHRIIEANALLTASGNNYVLRVVYDNQSTDPNPDFYAAIHRNQFIQNNSKKACVCENDRSCPLPANIYLFDITH
ncbi:unnamed protein product [Adineta ricciae]|uniref:Uncharacterized protein n=1 Tax=Adineta ricciae TaxID=249248 RepID=A0A815F3H6_ADIRI|nr:unnamed protein product [Adineta ricciae]